MPSEKDEFGKEIRELLLGSDEAMGLTGGEHTFGLKAHPLLHHIRSNHILFVKYFVNNRCRPSVKCLLKGPFPTMQLKINDTRNNEVKQMTWL